MEISFNQVEVAQQLWFNFRKHEHEQSSSKEEGEVRLWSANFSENAFLGWFLVDVYDL